MNPKPESSTVCWMAYYNDFSDMAVYDNEIDALRYAVNNHMEVIELRPGSVNQQINERHKR